MGKTTRSLTIDDEVYNWAKIIADDKKISVSGMVEKFLEFVGDPWVYCFECGKKFNASSSEICPLCSWMKCSHCGVCGCELSDEVKTAAYFMRRVYEDLLTGTVKQD